MIDPAAAQTFLIDFGRSNTNDGRQTTSPDVNGNYWNNMASFAQTNVMMSLNNLVGATNQSSIVSLTMHGPWQANGILTGGLLNPDSGLLGDLAIPTATEDFYFLDNQISATGSVTISGLDTSKIYNVSFFGSRSITSTRITTFSSGGVSTNHQTSGTDIGSDGAYDGNDKNVATLAGLSPGADGTLVVQVQVASGQFAYINVMRIVTRRPNREPNILIDFGRNDSTNGSRTVSPDNEGNYWNNISSDSQSTPVDQSLGNLVTMDSDITTIGVTLSTNWQANGRLSGGLFGTNGPSRNLIGDLAVETATEDFYYTSGNGVTGTVTFTGLDTNRTYHLQVFASRAIADTRVVNYRVGSRSTNIITSGTGVANNGLYSGNDKNLAEFFGLTSDASGQIRLDVAGVSGGFGYVNALKLTRSNPTVAETRVLIDFGNVNRLQGVDANGNRWSHITSGSESNKVMTNAAGQVTSVRVSVSGFVGTNPDGVFYSEGLLPSSDLYGGLFAFTNVVIDAMYLDTNPLSSTGTVWITGLDSGKRYNITVYGGRVSTQTRVTRYASGTSSVTLTNSGTGIGSGGANWNNNRVGTLAALAPVSGVITVSVARTAGDFGYLSAMSIEAVVSTTISNTVSLTSSDASTLITNGLVQLIAVSTNGTIDLASFNSAGSPGGDDFIIPAVNNPTYVGSGGATLGKLVEQMSYSEAYAGMPVYIRYWSDAVPTVNSTYGNSSVFVLPGLNSKGAFDYDFIPAGSEAPVAQYTIPTLGEWMMILFFLLIAWSGAWRLLRSNATTS